MEIRFTTKEESKHEQEQAFFRLTPEERLRAFFRLSNQILKLPSSSSKENNGNFVLTLYKKEND